MRKGPRRRTAPAGAKLRTRAEEANPQAVRSCTVSGVGKTAKLDGVEGSGGG